MSGITLQSSTHQPIYEIAHGEEHEPKSRPFVARKVEDSPPNIVDQVKKINWVHGTNSATLSLIPYSDYTLIPTGKLLNRGIAPMCGEISQGGMQTNGVNQRHISVCLIEDIRKAWKYAKEISHSFDPEVFQNSVSFCSNFPEALVNEEYFLRNLKSLEGLRKYSPDWDPTLVNLYRLKQWNPENFMMLSQKYQDRILAIIQSIREESSKEELMILNALDYEASVLLSAVESEAAREIVEENFPFLKTTVFPVWYSGSSCNIQKLTNPYRWTRDLKRNFETVVMDILATRMYGQSKLDNMKVEVQNGTADIFLECCWNDCKNLTDEDDPNIEELLNNAIRSPIELIMKKNALPNQKMLERIERLFLEDPFIEFDQSDRDNIALPFPVLLGSTKVNSFGFNHCAHECHVSSAKLGDGVDLIFVEDQYAEKMREWLDKHHLKSKVTMLSSSAVDEITKLRLKHSPNQVHFKSEFIDVWGFKGVEDILNKKVKPIYQVPYANGGGRYWHGVMHSMRVTLFAHIIASLHHDAGNNIQSSPKNLLIAAAMHDSAREDDGIDYWDSESGEKCRQLLMEVNKNFDEEEANRLQHAITEKDDSEPTSLEQKIIHDADCVEIFRCLPRDSDFQADRLWITKDLDEEITVQLVEEAKRFIKLTEKPAIKELVENSGSPLLYLYQMIEYANEKFGEFELMRSAVFHIRDVTESPDKYLLTPEVEEMMNSHLSSE